MASFSFKDSTGKWVPIVSGGGSGLAQLTETLTVENWNENQQTLTIDDIDEDSVIIVGASNNDIDIYNSCGIRAIFQGDKTLTFSCENLPESAIEIIVLYGPSTVVAPSPTPTPTPTSSKIIRKDFVMDWENGTEYTYTDSTITSNMNIINFVVTTGDIAAPIHWETQTGKIIFSSDNAPIGTISGYFFIADGGE